MDKKSNRYIKLGYFLKYLKPYKIYIIGILISLLFTSTSVLSLGIIVKHLIDDGFSKESKDLLDQALFILLTVTVILSVATYFRYYLVTKFGDLVIADVRKDIYRHILKLSLSFFETFGSGKILSRIITDTTLIQVVIGSSFALVIRNILILAGSLAMLIITSPKLSLIVSFIVPLVVIPIITLGRRVRKLSALSQDKVGILSSHIEETISAIKTVQSYSKEKFEENNFSNLINDILSISQQRVKKRALLTAIVIILTFSSTAIVLWIGGHNVLRGELSAGALSAFIFYAIMVSGSIGAISEVFGDLQRAAGAADGLVDILLTESDVVSPSYPQKLNMPINGEISFDKVTFYYPSRKDRPALDSVSFSVKPGERIAIVGLSGAGKSTIFNLALRFYDTTSGKILLDNIPIEKLDLNELRNCFAVVPQEPIIFSANVIENIRYSKESATEEEVVKAAKAAFAHDFIEKLPNGFYTNLGEKGVRLSGGEKQRIVIARALLHEPKILLLDEATNSLDAESEKLIQIALEKLMARCTTIVIAHRFSTVLKSDRIIVLENGKIVQHGKHDELIVQKSGLYARLAELQFNLTDKPNEENQSIIFH